MSGKRPGPAAWPAVVALGLLLVAAVTGVAYAVTRELADSYDREVRRVAVERAQLANELAGALPSLTAAKLRLGLTAEESLGVGLAIERLKEQQPLLGVAIFDRKRELVYPAAPGLQLRLPTGIDRALSGTPAVERHAEADNPFVEAAVPIRDLDGSVVGALALQLDEHGLEATMGRDYDRAFVALVGAAVVAWFLLLPLLLRVARLTAPYFSIERWRARRRVKRALAHGDLEVHYQPKVTLPGSVPCGVEGLVRMRRDGQIVGPPEFLPYIEETDLVHDLTAFVLDRAVADAATWRRAGHELGVSVNLAARSFSDASLPGRVESTLAKHGVPADALTLEVSERAVLDDPTRVAKVLDRLARIGVCISVDDFGTGNASLERLHRFPISEIKIDRSFIGGMAKDERPFVDAIATLAAALNLRVVAEGVEDAATLELVIRSGCDVAQGFFFFRPAPFHELLDWLGAHANDVYGGTLAAS